jgi:hypothetical protein
VTKCTYNKLRYFKIIVGLTEKTLKEINIPKDMENYILA